MKVNWKAVFFNILFYLLAVLFIFLGIQHAVFFYSWPIDMSRWVPVPYHLYWILGFGVYILLKALHIVEKEGEMFIREEPDIIIHECDHEEE